MNYIKLKSDKKLFYTFFIFKQTVYTHFISIIQAVKFIIDIVFTKYFISKLLKLSQKINNFNFKYSEIIRSFDGTF